MKNYVVVVWTRANQYAEYEIAATFGPFSDYKQALKFCRTKRDAIRERFGNCYTDIEAMFSDLDVFDSSEDKY